jgi:ribulose-phosphate 3-epimerase
MAKIEIIPAILEKDFVEIQKKIKKLEPYFKKVQVDFGDGKFVPDKFGCLKDFEKIKTELEIEAHIMIKEPWRVISNLVDLKFKKITFHCEAFYQVKKKTRAFAVNNLIKRIKNQNMQVGIAINPETSPSHIVEYLGRIDEVLLLGVNPGKQGQKLNPKVLEKVNFLRNFKENIKIGIDGGVNDKNIKKIAEAEIDRIYIGSFLWKEKNIKKAIQGLETFNFIL